MSAKILKFRKKKTVYKIVDNGSMRDSRDINISVNREQLYDLVYSMKPGITFPCGLVDSRGEWIRSGLEKLSLLDLWNVYKLCKQGIRVG